MKTNSLSAPRSFQPRTTDPEGAYTIRSGDTLWAIARAFGFRSLDDILAANPSIKDPDRIRAGQRLNIPQPAAAPAAPAATEKPRDAFEAQAPAAPAAVKPAPNPAAAATPAVTSTELTAAAATQRREGSFPLPKVLRDPAWKAVTGNHDVKKSVALGEWGEAKIDVGSKVVTAEDNPQRLAFAEKAKAQGRDTLWLETKGGVSTREATSLGDGGKQALEGGAEYSLTRPYTYESGKKDPAAVATALARNNTVDLPLTAEKARAVEQGSTFTLGARLKGGAELSGGAAGATADASREQRAAVRFLGNDRVEVTLDRDGSQAGKATARTGDAEAGAEASAARKTTFAQSEKFLLDLGKPDGRAAYDRIMRFDGSPARTAAEKADAGVERTLVKSQVTRETTLSGTATAPLTPRTDATLAGNVTVGRTVDKVTGEVIRRGEVGADAGLQTRIDDKTALGFDPSGKVSWELKQPRGAAEVAPPLDAARAQALPKGATFSLRGEGSLGVSASRSGGDLAATRSGDVAVHIKRGEGSLVELSADATRTTEVTRGGEKAVKLGAGALDLSYKGETTVTRESTGKVTLDLDKAEHRKAYDAAMRGDLGPARDVAREGGWWSNDKTWTNEDKVTLSSTPVEWAKARVELRRENVDPSDGRITCNADRAAFTEAAQAQGKDVRWVEQGGAIEPGIALEHSIAVGPAGAKVGFNTGGLVEYREMRPQVDGQLAGPSGPALGAEQALALPQGAEFSLRGRGTVGGTVGVTKGVEVATTGVRAGASVSVNHKENLSRELTVSAHRMEGSLVQVEIAQARERERGTDFTARVGVDVEAGKLLRTKDGSALAKLAGKADKPLGKYLSAEFQAGTHRKDGVEARQEFTLDLATPDGKKAYDALLRGDPTVAATVAGAPGAEARGVSYAKTSETATTENGNSTHLAVAGSKLFLSEALRRDSTTIERTGETTKRTDAAVYERNRKGLFSDQKLTLDAVTVRTTEDPDGKSFYRLAYANKDKLTSKGQVQDLVHLGESLGAVPARPLRVEKDGSRGISKILGNASRHGETKTELDIFLTEKGMQNIRGTTREDALRAYGDYVGKGAPPPWAAPQTADKARGILEEYRKVRSQGGPNDEDRQRVEDGLRYDYYHAYKRNIWDDAEHYRNAGALADATGRMAGSNDPAEWNRALADLGKNVGLDFHGSLASLNRLAGQDEVLVHRFDVAGKAVDISMKDEGLLQRPQ